jgi:hypothetical protein
LSASIDRNVTSRAKNEVCVVRDEHVFLLAEIVLHGD